MSLEAYNLEQGFLLLTLLLCFFFLGGGGCGLLGGYMPATRCSEFIRFDILGNVTIVTLFPA